MLLDEARVLEGDRPADPRAFSERLARVLEKSVGKGGLFVALLFAGERLVKESRLVEHEAASQWVSR